MSISYPQTPAPAPPAPAHRVSQADRDRVVELLTGAYVDGRLDVEEFQDRTQAALAARTPADLAAVLTDITPLVAAAPPRSLPTAPRAPSDERGTAAAAHLLGLFTSVVGPLVVAVARSRDKGFAHDQAIEALNFQLTVALIAAALVIPTIFTYGLVAVLYLPLGLAHVTLSIAGAASAAGGHHYRYPGAIRLAT